MWRHFALAAVALCFPQERSETHLRVSCVAGRGLNFEIRADGRVELILRTEDAKSGRVSEKLYTADSFPDFRRKFPEIVTEHRLGRFVPAEADPEGWEEFYLLLRRWREASGPEAWAADVDRVLERVGPRLISGRAGLRLGPVDSALAAHLKLPAGKGALVVALDSASRAADAGLRVHDVIVEFEGRPVRDLASFIERFAKELDGGFGMTVIRAGESRTIQVQPKR